MVTFKEAKEVSDSIVKALHPVSIVVFGSVAKEGSGTDLDLLIITDDKSVAPSDSNLLLHKCLKKFYRKFAIDPFIIPVSLLNEYYSKGSPFLKLIFREGRYLYMKEAVKEWLRQTEDELDMAEYLLEGKYFKGACYHSQQAIEKAIKARLIEKGWVLEKIHSIERLAALGRDYKIKLKLSDEEIVFLDSIYRGRYPAEAGLLPLGEPLEVDARRAVDIANRIFKTIQSALGK